MYITDMLTKTKKGKISHRFTLLRESYWEDGKVKNRTIANLTHCNPKEVAAMRFALQHKDDLSVLSVASKKLRDKIELEQGMSVGAMWVVYEIARKLGIEKALGMNRAGKLALLQVAARVIEQGCRLSAVRLAHTNAVYDILAIRQKFNEDHLQKAWRDFNLTVEEGLNKLSMLCSMKIISKEHGTCHRIPKPCQASAELLKAANVRLPKALPHLEVNIVSRKKLQSRMKAVDFTAF